MKGIKSVLRHLKNSGPSAFLGRPLKVLKNYCLDFRKISIDSNKIDLNNPKCLEEFNFVEKARSNRFKVENHPVSFSILTTIYENTPLVFFKELANSILKQDYQNFEWILLAHGPISPELNLYLKELSKNHLVAIFRLSENIGIMKAMRFCLERAQNQYIVPVDADDLLTSDALKIVTHHLCRLKFPDFIYSDEDHLSNTNLFGPYRRPEWDPILNLSNSYVWHLCTFKRSKALEIGVYSNALTNWCHDWDTITRFWKNNLRIDHIPEILYHWRQHSASSTNKDANQHTGSIDSQYNLLEQICLSRPNSEDFEIIESPIWRGAKEWTISRKPNGNLDTLDLLIARKSDFPNQKQGKIVCQLKELKEILTASSNKFVTLQNINVIPINPDWKWQMLKYFELVQDLIGINGRILDQNRKILGGGELYSQNEILNPMIGYSANDTGPFAFALKPRSVDCLNFNFAMIDRNYLLTSIENISLNLDIYSVGVITGLKALNESKVVGFDPAIEATVDNTDVKLKEICGAKDFVVNHYVSKSQKSKYLGPFDNWP